MTEKTWKTNFGFTFVLEFPGNGAYGLLVYRCTFDILKGVSGEEGFPGENGLVFWKSMVFRAGGIWFIVSRLTA